MTIALRRLLKCPSCEKESIEIFYRSYFGDFEDVVDERGPLHLLQCTHCMNIHPHQILDDDVLKTLPDSYDDSSDEKYSWWVQPMNFDYLEIARKGYIETQDKNNHINKYPLTKKQTDEIVDWIKNRPTYNDSP